MVLPTQPIKKKIVHETDTTISVSILCTPPEQTNTDNVKFGEKFEVPPRFQRFQGDGKPGEPTEVQVFLEGEDTSPPQVRALLGKRGKTQVGGTTRACESRTG